MIIQSVLLRIPCAFGLNQYGLYSMLNVKFVMKTSAEIQIIICLNGTRKQLRS